MQEILPSEISLESLKTLNNFLIKKIFKDIQGNSRKDFVVMDNE